MTLYAHLRFRLTVFTEMGGARKPQQRLNRPQGCGQCSHTHNPNHRVMNIIKQAGRGRVPRDVVRTLTESGSRLSEMGGARKPQQRLNRPQGCGQCCHTPNTDHRVMNIIKRGGYLGTLYAHLRFRLTVFTEMGGARKPQQRLNRLQGCGQCSHTHNPDHRVMNIIKQGGYLGMLYVHLPSPANDYQRWEGLETTTKAQSTTRVWSMLPPP